MVKEVVLPAAAGVAIFGRRRRRCLAKERGKGEVGTGRRTGEWGRGKKEKKQKGKERREIIGETGGQR